MLVTEGSLVDGSVTWNRIIRFRKQDDSCHIDFSRKEKGNVLKRKFHQSCFLIPKTPPSIASSLSSVIFLATLPPLLLFLILSHVVLLVIHCVLPPCCCLLFVVVACSCKLSKPTSPSWRAMLSFTRPTPPSTQVVK